MLSMSARSTEAIVAEDLESEDSEILDQPEFGITRHELTRIMSEKGIEAKRYIETNYCSVENICLLLQTNPVKGISGNVLDLDKRIRAFGKNEIMPKSHKSFLGLVWDSMKDSSHILLQVAAVISLALSFYEANARDPDEEVTPGWIEGAAILVSVAVVILVTAFSDYSKEKQFRGLRKQIQNSNHFSVIRNGRHTNIPSADIVVGDVCHIKYGDSLPADGLLLLAHDLLIDESSLTGETDYVRKDREKDLCLFSGTHVMEGIGNMLVTAVGIYSQNGIIINLIEHAETLERKKGSILHEKLTRLTRRIGYVGVFIALLTVVILSIRFSVEEFLQKGGQFEVKHIRYYVQFFIIGITVLIVTIPEGLPLAVTLSLAYSAKKMMNDNNLVRRVDACETMGNATTICSDKTGTLTTNRMAVVRSYLAGKTYSSVLDQEGIADDLKEILSVAISVNSSYSSRIIPSEFPGVPPLQLGNKTECALLGFVDDLGRSYEAIRKQHPQTSFTKVFTFNSARKYMTTVIPLSRGDGYRVFTKGASEIILSRCGFYHFGNHQINSLVEHSKLVVEQNAINVMASEALRTIAVAYHDIVPFPSHPSHKSLADVPNWEDENQITANSVLLAIVGVEDPLRPEVYEAIRSCQRAGITVRMITGDNAITARATAYKCGIIKRGDQSLVLDSMEFNRRIRDERGEIQQTLLDKLWPELRVLARSSPQDKYILVRGIIESSQNKASQVVAVTGDGSNDAPALKMADVGFAMGITGTDVAKEACDIVVMDDNFSSIVKAVMWGRNVYDSIAKFLQFQLTVNIVAVIVAFISALIIRDSPIRTVQMLWVNLIMDSFASLALATERPSLSLLKRKPYGRKKPLISLTMVRYIICQAIYMLAIIFFLIFYGDTLFDVTSGLYISHLSPPTQHFTAIFNTFVLMTLGDEVISRKLHGEPNIFAGMSSNPLFSIILVTTFILQVFIVQFGGYAFSTKALTLDQWAWCTFFGIGTLLWAQLCNAVYWFIISDCSETRTKYSKLLSSLYKSLPTSFITDNYFKKNINEGNSWTRIRQSHLHVQIRDVQTFQTPVGETDDAYLQDGLSSISYSAYHVSEDREYIINTPQYE